MANANPVAAVTLGDELSVSAIGFGAMALTHVYGEVDDAEALATLNRCVDLGVTFIDTANIYGSGNNERLIASLLADRRDEVTLATKFGITANPADLAAGGLNARGDADDAESLATLNRCLDLGVTFIDTANVYGGGGNERLIARLLADRRDEVTLATKFGIASNPAEIGRASCRERVFRRV